MHARLFVLTTFLRNIRQKVSMLLYLLPEAWIAEQPDLPVALGLAWTDTQNGMHPPRPYTVSSLQAPAPTSRVHL